MERRPSQILVGKTIAGRAIDDVEEIRSLGRALASGRSEIIAHHWCQQRAHQGSQSVGNDNYRRRVLLHGGGVTWPDRPRPPRLRVRSPYLDAEGRVDG